MFFDLWFYHHMEGLPLLNKVVCFQVQVLHFTLYYRFTNENTHCTSETFLK
jgi:hypothetical protein